MDDTEQSAQSVRKRTNLDRRQRKTRRAIFGAFEELMLGQRYSEITVAQIIDRADVGRSTFYAHFETKDDLLREMCTEMFDHVFEGVDSHCVTHAELETVNLEGRLAHLLYHLRDTHGSVCGRLLREGEPHFTTFFKGRLEGLIAKDLPAKPAAMPSDLHLDLLVSSFCELVVWWFEKGTPASPEELAAWFTGFVSVA